MKREEDTTGVQTVGQLPAPSNAPAGSRKLHAAIWTGTEMIVWGGGGDGLFRRFKQTGGRYNPNTTIAGQRQTAMLPLPDGCHTAVWTGSEMIVWGGAG